MCLGQASAALGVLLALAAVLPIDGQGSPADADAAALLSLPAAVPNWDAATAALAGADWQQGSQPCGGGGAAAWKGATCTGGAVTSLALPGLGLTGTLPPALAGLASLQSLDLSGNAFSGGIPQAWLEPAGFSQLASALLNANQLGGPLPAQLPALASQEINLGANRFNGSLPEGWASASLQDLDLSSNQLTGSLPDAWGARDALPQLAQLHLPGNRLSGTVPQQWTAPGGFEAQFMLEPRPSNLRLCGPVTPLNPSLFPKGHPEQNQPLIPAVNQMHTGDNLTTVVLTQRDLFWPGTSVTITNWLGSCAVPCDEEPGWPAPPAGVAAAGLVWPPVVRTNIFDVSWAYNMSITDLVELNPGAAALRPGAQLRVPCYPGGKFTEFGYYGGSAAFGHFSGGNQQAGPDGLPTSESLPGAMAAARVNGGFPNQFHPPSIYIGSVAPAPGDVNDTAVSQPVYWFVDMLAELQVVSVMVTAGIDMRNISVYVGSNSSSVFANTRVHEGLGLGAGQQRSVAANATRGRYVVIYGGTTAQATLGLDDIQVYTYETNAAANKAATLSGLQAAPQQQLAALTDNDERTCAQLLSPATLDPSLNGTAGWVRVDLGYSGTVGSVGLRLGANTTAGLLSRAYVTKASDDPLTDGVACNSEPRLSSAGAWVVTPCNREGRYLTLRFPSLTAPGGVAEVCELQAALTIQPKGSAGTPVVPAGDGSGSSGLSGGAIAGIVIGSLLGAALLLLLVAYLRWRSRWLKQQRMQLEAVAPAAKEDAAAAAGWHHVQGYGGSDEENGSLPDSNTSAAALAAAGRGGGAAAAGAVAAAAAAGAAAGAAVAARPSPPGAAASAARQSPQPGAADGHADPELGGAAAAAVGARGQGDAQPPALERVSELEMLRQFFRTLRLGRNHSLSQRSSEESRSRRRAGFHVVKGGAAASGIDTDVVTDLTKLPPGFLEVSPADIRLVECVGEGSFGEVWLAEYCGALVAVKILAKVKSDFMTHSMQQQLALRNLKKEALLMSKLRHPNVCLYLGAVTNPPCLVMEYCAKCSLDHLLRAGLSSPQMAKRLSWVRLLSMALDAAKGMLYLHSRSPPIAHRDLKSANLLVDSQWRVKVADFSLSRALEMGGTAYTVVSTNPRWLAPEVLSGHPGQLPADVWAFGTVLWELCTWRLPFEDLNTFQIIAKVQSQGSAGLTVPSAELLPGGPCACYPQLLELMQACWAIEPSQRPTFSTIVQQLGGLLQAELAPLQAAASGGGGAYAAVAARFFGSGGSERQRSDPSAGRGSSRGSIRGLEQGGSVGASSNGVGSPASPRSLRTSEAAGSSSQGGAGSATATNGSPPNPPRSF